jgi:protein-tyrosine phosphatase
VAKPPSPGIMANMTPSPQNPNDTGSPRPQSPGEPKSPQTASDAPESEESPAETGGKTRRFLITAGILLVVVGSIFLWKNVKYQLMPKRFGIVEAGAIYRSGQISEKLIEGVLKDNKIVIVVDLTAGDDGTPEEAGQNKFEVETCKKLKIEHHRFPMSGNGWGDLKTAYAPAIKMIHDAKKNGKPVLVHCAAGAQRTGGVVAFYRMLVQGQSGAGALDEMESYGFSVRKNASLHKFVNENMKPLAKELKAIGVIDQIPNPLPQLP